MIWKRLFQRIVLVTLICLLAACMPGLGGITTNTEPVTLRFVYLEGAADYQPLADAFHQKYPNITITLDPVNGGGNTANDFATKMGEADAIRIPTENLSTDMTGLLLPLDTFLSTDGEFPQADLFPGSLDALKLDGRQLGIPAGINPFVIFYLPKTFTDAGIALPDSSWTLDDLVQKAKAVTHADDAAQASGQLVYGYCGNPSMDPAIFTYLFGGGLFDSLTLANHPTLNTRANSDTLTWFTSLKTDFAVMPDISDPRGLYNLVSHSNCAMWMDWLSRSMFVQRLGEGSSASMVGLPSYRAQFNIATVDSYSIVASSTHPEAAWQWMRFLMQQPGSSGGLVPPLKSTLTTPEYTAHASPALVAIANSLPQNMVILGIAMYHDNRFGKVLDLFSQAAMSVYQGNQSAQDALDQAQQQALQEFQ